MSPLLLQADMLAKARAEFDSCIERVYNFDEFMAALDRKHMCLAPWCARGRPLVSGFSRGLGFSPSACGLWEAGRRALLFSPGTANLRCRVFGVF